MNRRMHKLSNKRAPFQLQSTQVLELTNFSGEDGDGVVIEDEVCQGLELAQLTGYAFKLVVLETKVG